MKTLEEPRRQAAQPGGLPAATGYVAAAAWEAWPDLDIDGEITGRNLRCLRCGWQTKYKTGRRRAAIRKHKCPHTEKAVPTEGGEKKL